MSTYYKIIKYGVITNGIIQLCGLCAVWIYITSQDENELIGDGLAYLILVTICLAWVLTIMHPAVRLFNAMESIRWPYLVAAIFQMIFPFVVAFFMLRGVTC